MGLCISQVHEIHVDANTSRSKIWRHIVSIVMMTCGPRKTGYLIISRTPSVPNLVLGSEYGRVFPAGVRPDSPSRDAANWLSLPLTRSVETPRRYGWLRVVLPSARLFRAPIWCPSGSGGTRETGNTAAKSLVVVYRMGTHQIRRGRRAARSSTSERGAEPLCARIKGANREVSEGKADL